VHFQRLLFFFSNYKKKLKKKIKKKLKKKIKKKLKKKIKKKLKKNIIKWKFNTLEGFFTRNVHIF
jgi:hypothetical protein